MKLDKQNTLNKGMFFIYKSNGLDKLLFADTRDEIIKIFPTRPIKSIGGLDIPYTEAIDIRREFYIVEDDNNLCLKDIKVEELISRKYEQVKAIEKGSYLMVDDKDYWVVSKESFTNEFTLHKGDLSKEEIDNLFKIKLLKR